LNCWQIIQRWILELDFDFSGRSLSSSSYLWPSIYLPNRNKYSRPSKAADYIDESSSIPDPRTGFSLADLPASSSIVWVAVRVSDVVSNNRIFKTCSRTWITPNSIDTRELVLGACVKCRIIQVQVDVM
jgi:hypothetical protein